MALSNTYDTTNPGSAVSNREDLLDVITTLAPQETPILSMAPKRKATATFHEYTVDSLSAPSTAGVAEGADVTAFVDKFSGRARLGNYVQKIRRPFMVSDLQQAVDSVGPAKIAQAEMKAVKELKRDIEATICSNNDRSAENGGGTAYALRGLGDWIDSAGPSDVPAAYRTPAASIHASGAFTETVLNSLITSIYRVNGMANELTLVADTALRAVIADFARTSGSTNTVYRQIQQSADTATIKLTVDFYESDNGMVSIVNMNPDCAPDTTNKDTGYLLNPEYMGVADLIPIGSSRVPNLGGGDRGYVDWTGTLEVLHPGAHGKITVLA
jgi:hypothetical protein